MTLKELLTRCNFKDIAPIIEKYYPEEIGNMNSFEIAFVYLLHLPPKFYPDSYNKIEISKEYYDEDEQKDQEQNYYIVVDCEGLFWESDLAKEIVVLDGLSLTDNEIAAHCLWEMTFCSFDKGTPEKYMQRELNWYIDANYKSTNPYTVAAEKLSSKQWHSNFPKRYKHAGGYSNYIELIMGKNGKPTKFFKYVPDNMMWRKARKNRIKRMRDHRQELRIEKLERMASIENDIRRLTTGTKSFKREELEYLFNTGLIFQDRYHSFAYNLHQRANYLIDLLSNYETEDFSKYTHFLLMFRTSSAHPLAQEELDMLQNFFSRFLPAQANIRFGYGTDDNLSTEVSLLLLGSC